MHLGMSASVEEAKECLRTGAGLSTNDAGCFIWHEPAPNGYGPFLSFWVAQHGSQPDEGWEFFWTCHNGPNACVNPEHMEVLTPEELERRKTQPLDGRDRDAWARAIAAERAARNWSQKRLAQELKVSLNTVKNWESGRSAPARTMARMVGYKLGWELTPRRFVVTLIVQEVVAARTAGEAAQRVAEGLALDPPRKKGEVYSVRTVK